MCAMAINIYDLRDVTLLSAMFDIVFPDYL